MLAALLGSGHFPFSILVAVFSGAEIVRHMVYCDYDSGEQVRPFSSENHVAFEIFKMVELLMSFKWF